MHLNALKSSLETGQWDIEALYGVQNDDGYVIFEVVLFPAQWGRPTDALMSMAIRVRQGHLKWFLTECGLEWPHRIEIRNTEGKVLRDMYLTDL